MRRRRRRTEDESPLDWDNMQSVPLVRPDATPESGDDYWIDFDPSVQLGDASGTEKAKKRKKKKIDPNLQRKLKEEVVSPYTQNWILRVGIAVFVLAVMWKLFGGDDATPIIRVPDL